MAGTSVDVVDIEGVVGVVDVLVVLNAGIGEQIMRRPRP